MDALFRFIKKFIPTSVFSFFQPTYHHLWALLSAIWFGYPSKKIYVIGVTGTKGKTSTTEILNAILEEAGYKTALSNTIRFKVGNTTKRNLYKMGMPGRGFLQSFLRKAVNAKCDYAIIEMTSEGAKLFRHKYIHLNAFIFTNLSPEHIEAHGSFENYRNAKLALLESLVSSIKENKLIIANKDDEHGSLFLDVEHAKQLPFSIRDAEPYTTTNRGVLITVDGVSISSPLIGQFNIYNILAAITFAKSQGIPIEVIKRAVEKFGLIKGRVEPVYLPDDHELKDKQKCSVIVDYAHTADSLEQLYKAFPRARKICVLGKCGGGRDTWSRSAMAEVADTYCDSIILTNEDPYDDDPREIVEEMKKSIKKHRPHIIMDRREAIYAAIKKAKAKDVVLITGKGTDPYIMGPNGKKTPWSDEQVAREELERVLSERASQKK